MYVYSFKRFCRSSGKDRIHKNYLGKLAFQTLFVQDVYAAKGSKTFWHYNIGYYKKWESSNLKHLTNYIIMSSLQKSK